MRKIILAAAAFAAATPAVAQIGNSQGLVAVTVQDVSILNNFLNGAQITALNNLVNAHVPIVAQVPISVAANVCPDATIAALAAQRKSGGGAACTATSGSDALARQVSRQVLDQHINQSK
jgi:hypothetical protein